MTLVPEKKKIWVLEDDANISRIYHEILSHEYQLEFFTTIHEFQFAVDTLPKPTLIISDLKLPDGDFRDFLKGNIDKIQGTQFLIVSANTDIGMLKHFLQVGAIDYLTKPFHVNELVGKVEFFIEQKIDTASSKFHLLDDKFINSCLTYKEKKILSVLQKSRDQFIPRKQIIDYVWQNLKSPNPKTIDVHLYNLRKKLKPLGLSINADHECRLQLS